MKLPYKSRAADTGIATYEILDDAIILEFKDRKHRYLYNATKPGPTHVDAMIQLAEAGEGLSTYVNQYVRDSYARKLPPR